MEIKERILQKAEELFFRYGVKSVTMDDMAKDLGISKKTIYQHFADKDDLVLNFVQKHTTQEKCEYESMDKLGLNTIEKFLKASESMRASMATMNPSMVFEIKKYHPLAWKVFHDFLYDFALGSIINDLKQGVAEGWFLNDFNPEILARLRLEQVELGFDIQMFSPNKFNMLEIQENFLVHFIRGILSPKGHDYFNQHFTKK